MEKQLDNEAPRGTAVSYAIGFALSLVLTLIPYFLVTRNLLEGGVLMAALFGFALMQLVVQLVFFLHLGREPRPRWNLMAFLFMLLVIFIVVGGSIWIMQNLNYHTMDSHQNEQLMNLDKQKGF